MPDVGRTSSGEIKMMQRNTVLQIAPTSVCPFISRGQYEAGSTKVQKERYGQSSFRRTGRTNVRLYLFCVLYLLFMQRVLPFILCEQIYTITLRNVEDLPPLEDLARVGLVGLSELLLVGFQSCVDSRI